MEWLSAWDTVPRTQLALRLWLSTPGVLFSGVKSEVFPAAETGEAQLARGQGLWGTGWEGYHQFPHPALICPGLRVTRNRVQGYQRLLAAIDDLTFQRGPVNFLTITSKRSLTGKQNLPCIPDSERPAPSLASFLSHPRLSEAPFGPFPTARLLCTPALPSLENSGLSAEDPLQPSKPSPVKIHL